MFASPISKKLYPRDSKLSDPPTGLTLYSTLIVLPVGRYPEKYTLSDLDGLTRFAGRVIYAASCSSPDAKRAVFSSEGLLILLETHVMESLYKRFAYFGDDGQDGNCQVQAFVSVYTLYFTLSLA